MRGAENTLDNSAPVILFINKELPLFVFTTILPPTRSMRSSLLQPLKPTFTKSFPLLTKPLLMPHQKSFII